MSSERTRRRTFYEDWGSGQPIVFSHGWPLSAGDWDAQMMWLFPMISVAVGSFAHRSPSG